MLQHRAPRRSGFFRPAFFLTLPVLTILVASCGDGTSPDKSLPITAPSGVVRPYESIELNLGADALTEQGIPGTLGASAVTGGRLTDSTLVLLIPDVGAGSHVLTLSTGGKTYKTILQVAAPIAVSNPQASLDSLTQRLDSIVERQLAALGTMNVDATSGIDSAAIHAQLTTLGARVATLRADIAALSAAERAQVASFLAAHPALLNSPVSSASLRRASLIGYAGQPCTAGWECYDALDKTLVTIRNGCLAYVGIKIAADAASWLVGIVGKISIETVEIVITGILVAYVLTEIVNMYNEPVKPSILSGSNVVVPTAMAEVIPTLRIGTAGAMSLDASYRSLTAGDLLNDAAASGIAASLRAVQDIFETLSEGIPFFSLPKPAFPSAPAATVVHPVPPAQLSLGDMTGSRWSGSSAPSGSNWMVTLSNAAQGKDHTVLLPIRFTPPGLATQNTSRSVLVQPQTYRVATLQIPSTPSTVGVDKTLTLEPTAKDSAGRTLTAADLGSRKPSWTSSNTAVATVDANGVITGKAEGSSTITASLEAGHATLLITVIVVAGTPPQITGFTQSCTESGSLHRLEISFVVTDGPPFNPSSGSGAYSPTSYPTAVFFLTGGMWQHASNSYSARLLSGTGNDGIIEVLFNTNGGAAACRQDSYYNTPQQWFDGWKVFLTDRFNQNSGETNFDLTVYRHTPP